MNPFSLDIVIKASALLAAAGLVDAVLSRRGSAAARSLVWSLTMAALLVLPIASYALPHWLVRIPVARANVAAAGSVGVQAPEGPAPSEATPSFQAGAITQPAAPDLSEAPLAALTIALASLSAVYAAGVLILLVRLGREPFVLRRLTRTSREIGDPAWLRLFDEAARQSQVGRPVRLLQSTSELMPMTYGTRRPTVVLPASADAWTDDRRRAVLLHELAHVARRDCFIQKLTSLACALYWPHPGVWWAARRLRTERELACDDLVLAAGAGAREYAGHLLDLARSLGAVPAPATALGMARARQLETRLLAVLDAARNRAVLHRGGLAVAIAAATAVLLPMAALRAAVVPTDPMVAPVQAAQPRSGSQELTGTWELRPGRETGTVNVSMRTGRSSHGRTMTIAQLEALTGVRIAGANGPIQFPLRREAGTFTIDGVCRSGVCGGTYAFEPNPAFPVELAKRGIGAPTAREQFDLAVMDVGVAWLDELSKHGYKKPDIQGMVRAAEHGVSLDYVRGMAGLGYRVGTVDELVRMRDHGVDPGYVRGMAANGFSDLSSDDLVRARDHGVDPTYVKGMRDLGYEMKDLARLIAARDHGVDPEYVRGMQQFGYRLELDDLRRTRDHGVDPTYVRGLASLGYTGLTVEALVNARDHGVDPEYIRGLAALGYKALPLDTLVRMRDHGVDPEFVRRLQQRGSGQLSVDELIRRRDRGDGDPHAAAREIAASLRVFWQSLVAHVSRLGG
jgi:beta-lactamase regulating signal transducer with metallopeptidase domain